MKAKLHQDVPVGIFILICCAVFFLSTVGMVADAALFPRLLLIMLALMGAWVLADGVKKTKAASGAGFENALSLPKLVVPGIAYLYITAYVLLFFLAGYFVATPIFMISLMRRFQLKSWKTILLITFGFVTVLYFLFVRQLNVPVLDFGYLERVVMGY